MDETPEQTIARLTERFTELEHQYYAQFKGLDPEKFNWKPAPEEWSIAQVIDHINKINSSYFPLLEDLEEGNLRNSWTARLPLIPSFIGKLIRKTVSPDFKKKMKTMPIWTPPAIEFTGEIWKEFEQMHTRLREWILKSEAHFAQKTMIHSPAMRSMSYTLEDAFEILLAHEERHYHQANGVLNQLKEFGETEK